ncbi:hypothetical protein HPP92_017051 [Vanilla planifolia]|uniref:Hexosyltransferase n=1 Tax=Vanilla planifolia TaxID=51239 RepID=A0A835USR0_VANPL|nr:hypothetical protein HPP92_017051 [Vanilla planifolia]
MHLPTRFTAYDVTSSMLAISACFLLIKPSALFFSTTKTKTPAARQAKYMAAVLFFLFLLPIVSSKASNSPQWFSYIEAPHFANSEACPTSTAGECDPSVVHIAMNLDSRYLRGSIAAVHSVLRHTVCPKSLFFHFVVLDYGDALPAAIRVVFPSLRFRVYRFQEDRVRGLISASVRAALENPLNYARNYLADLLPPCVRRVVYLDSDIIAVDDVRRLWESSAAGFDAAPDAVIAAPEYCNANFTRYFTAAFWNGPWGQKAFEGGDAGRATSTPA